MRGGESARRVPSRVTCAATALEWRGVGPSGHCAPGREDAGRFRQRDAAQQGPGASVPRYSAESRCGSLTDRSFPPPRPNQGRFPLSGSKPLHRRPNCQPGGAGGAGVPCEDAATRQGACGRLLLLPRGQAYLARIPFPALSSRR